ncbi:MAG: hypothetical protein M1831_000319 [Alyxoria varia]|nr:MAG: hypothetical protein M1831_000319 [Alyxoria varia]
MRQTQIFSGSSHPSLVESICDRLGQRPAKADLGKFSNGETKVQLNTSIRDQDVFIVQSGSSKINDAVMELLVMVSACKSGSAKSITAVMPYFPYSRQSKKKAHRGAITAKMIANLLNVAGVDHVITIDLHASQMKGFFRCPVDNLMAEASLIQWIKVNIPEWRNAVVVGKNPGGTKRVTSLADLLKIPFGVVMTDRYRPTSAGNSMNTSMVLDSHHAESYGTVSTNGDLRQQPSNVQTSADPNINSEEMASEIASFGEPSIRLARVQTAPSALRNHFDDSSEDEDSSGPSREIIRERLIHGHIPDGLPSPASTWSTRTGNGRQRAGSDDENGTDDMTSSFLSTVSSLRRSNTGGLGGSGDMVENGSDDEEEHLKNPELESTVTFVGNVKDKIVFIIDDMIDKSATWIAAAETVVKRGGANKVYCMATHGLFGDNCLQEMEDCYCIDHIIVTDTLPIPRPKSGSSTKLEVLDVAPLLAEAIRRNHHGESISQLFFPYD